MPPRLLAQSSPSHVVSTASRAGRVPSAGMVPYATTKAAVVGLSEALDREVVGQGGRVHALCPGVIDTAIVRTCTMRGEWVGQQQGVRELDATKGTSPDVVARAALAALPGGAAMAGQAAGPGHGLDPVGAAHPPPHGPRVRRGTLRSARVGHHQGSVPAGLVVRSGGPGGGNGVRVLTRSRRGRT